MWQNKSCGCLPGSMNKLIVENAIQHIHGVVNNFKKKKKPSVLANQNVSEQSDIIKCIRSWVHPFYFRFSEFGFGYFYFFMHCSVI